MNRESINKYKYHLVSAVVFLFVVLFAVIGFGKEDTSKEELFFDENVSDATATEEEISTALYVDIKGAVKKPGMYEAATDMRVWDAVMLAGGVLDQADTKNVNYSQRIVDQMIIYIPLIGEEANQVNENTKEITSQEIKDTRVDLNKANESELQSLSGIGQKKAQEIIRYREENDGFQSIDELKNISGIGEKTIERLKDFIQVG